MKKTMCLFAAAGALALSVQLRAGDKHAAVSSRILAAHTIYVDNATPDVALQLDAVMGLNKWGRFDVVDSARKADIVLRLVGSSVVTTLPDGQSPASFDPRGAKASLRDGEELAPAGCTRVEVIEPKTNSLLWSEIRKTGSVQERSRLVEGLHEAVDQQERHK